MKLASISRRALGLALLSLVFFVFAAVPGCKQETAPPTGGTTQTPTETPAAPVNAAPANKTEHPSGGKSEHPSGGKSEHPEHPKK